MFITAQIKLAPNSKLRIQIPMNSSMDKINCILNGKYRIFYTLFESYDHEWPTTTCNEKEESHTHNIEIKRPGTKKHVI